MAGFCYDILYHAFECEYMLAWCNKGEKTSTVRVGVLELHIYKCACFLVRATTCIGPLKKGITLEINCIEPNTKYRHKNE